MRSDEFYTNLVYSITRAVVQELPDGAVYVDWDAHAEIHELPSDNLLVGVSGVSLSQEHDQIEVVFSIGIATQNDPNLFQLRAATSKYYALVRPEQTIDIYDHALVAAGGAITPVSWMVVTTPLEILPVNRAEIRNVQFINVSALLNPASLSFSG